MVLKTFNLDKEAYEAYSEHCRKHGISMSKRVENFIKKDIEDMRRNMQMDVKKDVIENKNLVTEHKMIKYC